MTSSNETEGLGVTTQPMNSQIAPAEIAFISATGVKSVAMLVDTSDYTLSIADQTSDGLLEKGIEVIQIPITAGSTDFSAQISKALATNPGMIYSSTYYPEGSLIAQQLLASAASTPCFMGLANVDPAFVTEAGLAAAQHCTFSGVPAAPAVAICQGLRQGLCQGVQEAARGVGRLHLRRGQCARCGNKEVGGH